MIELHTINRVITFQIQDSSDFRIKPFDVQRSHVIEKRNVEFAVEVGGAIDRVLSHCLNVFYM